MYRGLLISCLGVTGAAADSGATPGVGHQLPDARAARNLLFHHKGGEVVLLEQNFLSTENLATFSAMGGIVPYYGAIAMAPDEGMLSEANQAAVNHHSIAAAEHAALRACNAARSGGRRCQVVLHFLPRDYEPGRVLTLSQAATGAMRREYRRGRGEKALAISPSTGLYAIAKGVSAAEAAVQACNSGANADADALVRSATDCITVVAD